MVKGIRLMALSAVCALLFSGCLDYRGLDELSIVAGFTVDASEEDPNRLHLCFEVVDTTASSEEKGKKTILMEADGATINEAISNANKLLPKDLYFGNADVLVVSHQVAETLGMTAVMEPLMRDYAIRDTLQVIISKEETAKDLISNSAETPKIQSYTISESLDWQKRTADSTRSMQIFEIYEVLKSATDSLTLPAYRVSQDLDEKQPMLDGMSIFSGDRLAGEISSEDTKYYLFLTQKLKQGTFTYHYDGDPQKTVTIALRNSTPKLSYTLVENTLTLKAELSIEAVISEIAPSIGPITDQLIKDLEQKTANELAQRINGVVKAVQEDSRSDVFGFAGTVYRRAPDLWESVREDWPTLFAEAEVEIKPTVNLKTTGLVFDY